MEVALYLTKKSIRYTVPVVLGEVLQLVPPGKPELRKAMEEDHERFVVVALLHVVHPQVGDANVPDNNQLGSVLARSWLRLELVVVRYYLCSPHLGSLTMSGGSGLLLTVSVLLHPLVRRERTSPSSGPSAITIPANFRATALNMVCIGEM